MPYAHDLLEQAKHLANREKKRPRQASLRRAVSTAYYALFHLLIHEARFWPSAFRLLPSAFRLLTALLLSSVLSKAGARFVIKLSLKLI